MEELLSPGAARALADARLICRRRGADAVTPIDLLQALATQEDGAGPSRLVRLGVRLDELLGRLSPAAEPGEGRSDEAPAPTEPLLSREVAEAVDLAQQNAVLASRFDRAETTDLLDALVERSAECAELLVACGLDRQRLERDRRTRTEPEPLAADSDQLPRVDRPASEAADRYRVIDACGNRAAEALRVLEDHARFIARDAGSAARLKELRHAIRAAIGSLGERMLLASRDTPGDLGRAIKADDEFRRADLSGVVAANFKRAQEAIRTLEEVLKVDHPMLAAQVERIRYRLYTLESRVARARSARDLLADARLCWLCDPTRYPVSLPERIRGAAQGGVDLLQLRDKTSDDGRLLAVAVELRAITRDAGILFVVNDRPDIALLAGADGVHLGQEDLPARQARRILGPDAIVGVSTHDADQLDRAADDGADYVGIGPVFPSPTKEFEELAGLAFVRAAADRASLPAFAIGGITCFTAADVLDAGAQRLAVSGAITEVDDPRAAAARLRGLIDSRLT